MDSYRLEITYVLGSGKRPPVTGQPPPLRTGELGLGWGRKQRGATGRHDHNTAGQQIRRR